MKKVFFLILSYFIYGRGFAQDNLFHSQGDLFHASLGTQGIMTSKDHVPFWMRSNQFGSIPLPGTSASFIGTARIDYDSTNRQLVDWGASVEARADLGSSSRVTLIEGYGKLRVSIFELKAGRVKEIMGLVDTSLSSGAFAISGNALGIPKVQISIPEYWNLPFGRKLFAIKGNFALGWLGEQKIQYPDSIPSAKTYFHQSSFYARLGRPDWRLKLYAGFNHQVFWGSEKKVFGKNYPFSDFKTFEYVVLGRTWVGSKIGNHLGSVDLRADYDFENIRIGLYRQNFYDEGALAKLANIADGLNGLCIENKATSEDGTSEDGFHWHKVLFEFFYSKNQAGYPDSKRTKSGDENYYNNYQYTKGWSYKGLGLGNPFITTSTSTRAGLPNDSTDFFNNNRVMAFYGGMEGSIGDYYFTAKASYSFNYGTFGTSQWGHSTGYTFSTPHFGLFKEVKQFSAYLEVKRALKNGWEAGAVAALDAGDLLYNSSGLILKLKKSF